MRRAVVWLTIVTVALALLGGGVALAKKIRCDGGKCFGTNRADSMYGTNRYDNMFAKKGGDYLTGRGAGDDLNGQEGNDRIYGGYGDDWVKGGKHADVVKGNLGNDRITGGSGNNTLRAADGMRDLIVCGPNSYNFIYYDPNLDRFNNCVFRDGALKAKAGETEASITARGLPKKSGL